MTNNDALQLVELPWTHKRQTSMPPVGFEPIIPAIERAQIYALHGADTGISSFRVDEVIIQLCLVKFPSVCIGPRKTDHGSISVELLVYKMCIAEHCRYH
jgi:hypothetical protein